MDKVGTPEILREIAALTFLIDRCMKAVDVMEKGVTGATSRLEQKFQEAVGENRSFLNAAAAETKSQLTSIQAAVTQSIIGITQELETFGKSIADESDKLRSHTELQAQSIKRWIVVGLVVVTIAIGAVVYFIKGM